MRTRLTSLFTALLAAAPLLLIACGGDDDDDSMAITPCDEDDRGEVFSADMEKTGDDGLAIFVLNSIAPDPPDIGDNDWQITVRDAADDSPQSGCTLDVRPWMPDHEHGSNQPQGVEADPGVYSVGGVRFIMPGYWENTVTVHCSAGDDDDSAGDDASGWTDSAIFGFCLEG